MEMCSQRIEIEKNTSKEGERSVQIVHGSEAWWWNWSQNAIVHKAYWRYYDVIDNYEPDQSKTLK